VTDVTEQHYNAQGPRIDRLAEYVNRIEFDISGIRRPFATGAPIARPGLRLIKG
jgi:hypothetical protein